MSAKCAGYGSAALFTQNNLAPPQSTEVMTSRKTFFAFQHFEYYVSVEHDEKPPQPKFGGYLFMGARDMTA